MGVLIYDWLTRRANSADRIRSRASDVRETENAVVEADVSEKVSQTEMLIVRIAAERLTQKITEPYRPKKGLITRVRRNVKIASNRRISRNNDELSSWSCMLSQRRSPKRLHHMNTKI